MRKRRTGGRGLLNSWELFAYGETNSEGKFEFGFLPAGTYRFFVEFPGIPMDKKSETEFIIGQKGASDNQISLVAEIKDEGISVQQVKTLGLNSQKKVVIYPNPASHKVIITSQYTEIVTFYDVSGKQVLQAKTNETVNIQHLESGVYTLSVGNQKIKLIKE